MDLLTKVTTELQEAINFLTVRHNLLPEDDIRVFHDGSALYIHVIAKASGAEMEYGALRDAEGKLQVVSMETDGHHVISGLNKMLENLKSLQIRRWCRVGYLHRDIARMLGISPAVLSSLMRKRGIWKGTDFSYGLNREHRPEE